MFADLSLAKLLEMTEGKAGASFVEARAGDSHWRRIGGAFAMFDGADSPTTQTFGLGLFEEASDATVQHLEEFYFGLGAGVHHEVCPFAGVDLASLLAQRRYLPTDFSSVLFCELPARLEQPLEQSGIRVRLSTHEDAPLYARKAGEGWGESKDLAELVSSFSAVMLAAKGFHGFLAEQQGITIATAGLIIHENVALLAGASTVPQFRGRGAQAALLAERLRYAAENGCDLAMMVSAVGSGSQRNAERSGFRIAYTRTKWSLPHN